MAAILTFAGRGTLMRREMRVRAWVGLVAGVLTAGQGVIGGGAGRAFAADGARGAVAAAPLRLPASLLPQRAGFQDALTRGLIASGRSVVVIAKDVLPTDEPCDSSACWANVRRATGARYLVRGDVTALAEARFRAVLSLTDLDVGREVGTERHECDLDAGCSLGEVLRLGGKELMTYAASSAPPPPPAAAVVEAPPPAPPSGGAAPLPPELPVYEPAPWWRWAPWGVGAVGVGLVATGVVMLAVDGHASERARPSPDKPELDMRRYDTKGEGIVFTSVGAAALVGSVVWLLVRPAGSSATQLGWGRDGLVWQGRF